MKVIQGCIQRCKKYFFHIAVSYLREINRQVSQIIIIELEAAKITVASQVKQTLAGLIGYNYNKQAYCGLIPNYC